MKSAIFISRGTFLLLLLTSLLLLMNFGCSSEDKTMFQYLGLSSDDDEGMADELAGTYDWQLTEMGYGTCDPNSTPDVTITPAGSEETRVLVLNENGQYTETTRDGSGNVVFSESGTWRVEGNSLIFTEQGTDYSFGFTLTDGTLTKTFRDCTENFWERHTYRKR